MTDVLLTLIVLLLAAIAHNVYNCRRLLRRLPKGE